MNERPVTPGAVTRDLVVAYATLAAFVQHWPSRATEADRELLSRFAWVRAAEPDRYLKQRRIAIARLAAELTAPASSA